MLAMEAERKQSEMERCNHKIMDKVNQIINAGEYSHLVTFSGLFGGQYDLDFKSVARLLYYTERFSTALDYDVATDYQLWLLIRQYKQRNKPIPAANKKPAHHIYKRSNELHRLYPKDCYFNKHSLKPVSYAQAEHLKHSIHKIITIHGINEAQYHQVKAEYQSFLDYGY